MDIRREENASHRRWSRRWLILAITVISLFVFFGLTRIGPAAPRVDASGVWVSSVQRGKMVRAVRGSGSLVPESIVLLSAPSEATVESVDAEVGSVVTRGTPILQLVSPGLSQDALDALTQLEGARANAQELSARIEGELLEKEAALAAAEADYREAQLKADADRKLAAEGLLPTLTQEISEVRANELEQMVRIAKLSLERASAAARAQREAQESRINQLEALHRHVQGTVDDLSVRAGTDGVLQEILVDKGQRVQAGTVLAQIVVGDGLKAELKIPQVQSRDLQVGQKVEIDTGLGGITGAVEHIDPNVRQGSVLVSVALGGELPRGARVDLAVQGTILIDEIPEALFIERPAYWEAEQTVGVFRLDPDGKAASRQTVALGRSSAATIEVLSGLEVGDRVILSDTSQWDNYNRIRLD